MPLKPSVVCPSAMAPLFPPSAPTASFLLSLQKIPPRASLCQSPLAPSNRASEGRERPRGQLSVRKSWSPFKAGITPHRGCFCPDPSSLHSSLFHHQPQSSVEQLHVKHPWGARRDLPAQLVSLVVAWFLLQHSHLSPGPGFHTTDLPLAGVDLQTDI